jgi:hypothetical protein
MVEAEVIVPYAEDEEAYGPIPLSKLEVSKPVT